MRKSVTDHSTTEQYFYTLQYVEIKIQFFGKLKERSFAVPGTFDSNSFYQISHCDDIMKTVLFVTSQTVL